MLARPLCAESLELDGRTFHIPDGMTLRKVAGPPLVQRPICADFDELGRLYVAESSGSNDPVRQQYAEKPHQILRLEDTDGDGAFDRRTVFVDRIMFPEGTLWHEGSLYVAAPPEIWKFTDTDDDGVADQQEVWFDGKTLTGCANDLHGPYLGPDGWIYWCKGAFAEQTHEQTDGSVLVTRAAHIFRRRSEGGPIEAVMTGGMDNPVEIVFTPGGDVIFTTTFLQHPAGGNRDGLLHAVYGGLYGKDHRVLEGHRRTGDLMPVLVHLGPAAPCGLARLGHPAWGPKLEGNLLACCFNLHKITRHQLEPSGASFTATTTDFVACDDIDFHPTDVLEDADGSLLIVDTGGWYKLCCPTSQLPKPDVLGAIYRLEQAGARRDADPRGLRLDWTGISTSELVERLVADPRPAVQRRACQALARMGAAVVPPLEAALIGPANSSSSAGAHGTDAAARCRILWTLARIDDASARRATANALSDADPVVRQAAASAVSLWRDASAASALIELLDDPSLHVRRVAAEALGRTRAQSAIGSLLDAAQASSDRFLQHAIRYALMDIGEGSVLAAQIQKRRAQPLAAAAGLMALEQIDAQRIALDDIIGWLDTPVGAAPDQEPQATAWWILQRHPEWDVRLADWLRTRIADRPQPALDRVLLERIFVAFAGREPMQRLMADVLRSEHTATETRLAVLHAIAQAGEHEVADVWAPALAEQWERGELELARAAVAAAANVLTRRPDSDSLREALQRLAADTRQPVSLRLHALVGSAKAHAPLDEAQLAFVLEQLDAEQPLENRSYAIAVLEQAPLGAEQQIAVARKLAEAHASDLPRMVLLFGHRPATPNSRPILQAALEALMRRDDLSAPLVEAVAAIVPAEDDQLQGLLSGLRTAAAPQLDQLRAQIDQLLQTLPPGDIGRGQRVFQSKKAACNSCHAIGYLGGTIGPDLTRIGQIRSKADLLEAILHPSLSFVRSYEPVVITTRAGQIFSGVVADQSASELVVVRDATTAVRVARDEIDVIEPGRVSIMPEGMDKILSPQEIADLLAMLQAAR